MAAPTTVEDMPVGNAWDWKGIKTIRVKVESTDEEIMVDGEYGPIVNVFGGGQKYYRWVTEVRGCNRGQWKGDCPQQFHQMTYTGREVMVCMAAKANKRLKERMGPLANVSYDE
mmetsp:Transcript_28212/g.64079  ORF Transcript_28212/g.64079 Transcript_28212/m.64079 type:complete len:114 (-) Transcript_28212:86-427(-)